MLNNIRKILWCIGVISITVLFVYCSQTKVEVNKTDMNDNLIVFKARMYAVYNEKLQEQLEEEVLNNILVAKTANSTTLTVDEIKVEEVKQTVTKKKAKKNKYSFTKKEIDLLERVVMGEAEGESMDGKLAVLQVVINRSIVWDKSIKEVLYQKHQFSAVWTRRFNLEPTEECKEAVKLFIKGVKTPVGKDVLYFYAPDECNSYWHETKLKEVKTIGGHKFFKER